MPAAMSGALARLKQRIGEFSLPQKTFALIAIAALVLGAVAIGSWASRPTMSPLFSGMSGEDASAVVDQLQSAGISYELSDGGSTVLVPAESVYEQRIALAAQGLPGTEGGYSLLDDMGMTSSDFQQQVTYQRALEGELARTVSALEGVSSATVHLALPEESVFTETAAQPTASVFVQAETGKRLDSGGIQAVVNLISSAVPGMDPLNVSVVDAEGEVLTASPGGGDGAAEYEERVAAQVQAMLTRVLGTGNAVVSVNAELNRDATQRTSETFTPAEDTPPLSQMRSTEEYQGTGQGAGGVLGPDNIAVPDGGAGAGTYTREDETVNNAVNKVTELTSVNPGGVTRQSVSVVVDSVAAAGISVQELQDVVIAAAGIDPERGDQISVAQMAFDTTTAETAQQSLDAQAEAAASAAAAAQRDQLVRWGLIALVAVIVLAVILRRLRRNNEPEELDLGEFGVTPVPELPPEPETSVLEMAPAPVALEPSPTETARQGVVALADEDPDAVAERLRQWMAVKS